MGSIIYIKEGKTKGYITVGVMLDGKRVSYTVPNAVYSSIGSPARLDVLDDFAHEELCRANAEYMALKKALSLLSYTDNSERALKMKLCRAGFSYDAAEGAVIEAVRLGYIDEERQLKRLILTEANEHLSGPMRLIAKLSAKGYSAAKIKRITEELLECGELDFDENRKKLLDKYLSDDSDDEEKNKLLYKYGYRIC